MIARIRSHMSFANAVSLLALFVALGGGAYAASLPRNSVGAAQIKTGGVGSSEVRNGSLRSFDFRAGDLPVGAVGPAGPQGAKGDKGDPGTNGAAGADGTAAAYARVQANGTLEPGVGAVGGPAQFKGVDQADIQHPAAGVYCFGGLDFTLASAVVSADNAGAAADDQIANVAIQRGNNLNGCDATHQQARVQLFDVSTATMTDNAFTVWFE